MKIFDLPRVWDTPMPEYTVNLMRMQAEKNFARNTILPSSIPLWEQEKKRILSSLADKLHLQIDHSLPLDIEVTGTVRRKNYRIEKLSFQAAVNRYVTGCIYIPDGKGPFPAVLVLHGHRIDGHLHVWTQTIGHILAANGFAALSIDTFGSGERSRVHGRFEPHGGAYGTLLNHLGETLPGILLADNMRALDLLSSLPYIDAQNIGVTGCSGGGNQTMYLTAFDERIKAGVSVCSVGTYRSYIMGANCICETIPEAMNICEQAGLIACAAPRAFAMVNGLYDEYQTFVPAEMFHTYNGALPVYRMLGAADNLQHKVLPTEHDYSPEAQIFMLEFFNTHLRQERQRPVFLPDKIDFMTRDEAMVYPAGKRPEKIKGILDYCADLTPAVRAAAAKLTFQERRSELEKVLNSAPVDIRSCSAVGSTSDGAWQKIVIETEHDVLIPCLMKMPQNSSNWQVLAAPLGRQQLTEREYFHEALSSGDGLLLPDLFGSGETGSEYNDPQHLDYHNMARSCFFLGWSMMGEWVRAYTLVSKLLKSAYHAESVTFYGCKDTALAALLAAGLYSACDHAVLEEAPLTLNWHKEIPAINIFTCALFVNKILLCGDMDDFAALVPESCRLTWRKRLKLDGSTV